MESAKTRVKDNSNPPNRIKTNSVDLSEEMRSWRLHLGHCLPLRSVKGHIAKGLLSPLVPAGTECEPCAKGKYSRRFSSSLTTATKPSCLHCDTKKKVTVISDDGHKYFRTVAGEYSMFTYVCPMWSRNEASKVPLHFVKRFGKQFEHAVTAVHADGSCEFRRARDPLDHNDMDNSVTAEYTPESNGLAIQTHSFVMSQARAYLQNPKQPEGF